MKTINETIPVKIRAEFWLIFKNWAIGIKGPIPICIIFLTISLLSLLYLFSIFLISIVFKKYNENSREIVRKIIHIGIGPLIPIAQFLKIDQNSALIFTGIISLMVFINYTYKLFPTIEDVERKSYGTLFLSEFIYLDLSFLG